MRYGTARKPPPSPVMAPRVDMRIPEKKRMRTITTVAVSIIHRIMCSIYKLIFQKQIEKPLSYVDCISLYELGEKALHISSSHFII
jgi:hypothetical protein